MNWQQVLTLVGAATLTFVLGACTRTPEPEKSDFDARRENPEDTSLCERYARTVVGVIQDRYPDRSIEVLHDVDRSNPAPDATGTAQTATLWTVKWSCKLKELTLSARLPSDRAIGIIGEGAGFRVYELVGALRRKGLDPKADRFWIVYESLYAGDTATFDPRQPYLEHW